MQFETYYSKFKKVSLNKEALTEHIIEKANKMKLFSKNDVQAIDVRERKYANILFEKGTLKNSEIVKNYLNQIGIKSIGRFGEWKYFWSDQSLLSGKNIVDEL